MRTRELLTPKQLNTGRETADPAHSSGGIPNSAMLARMDSDTVQPQELESLSGVERSVSPGLGQEIEARLGARMPGLRVFEDSGLMEQYGQRAYARGNEIHVAQGEFSPHTAGGRELLMHEASHILQQGSGMARGGGVLESPSLESMAHSGMTAPSNFVMPAAAAGSPIQGWNPFKRIKASHQRAVDDFNNNRDDYDNMSAWERFKWSVKNPLARLTAASKTNDTATRNTERALKLSAAYDRVFEDDKENAAAEPDVKRYYSYGLGSILNENDKERTGGYVNPAMAAKLGLLNLGATMGSTALMTKTGAIGTRVLGAGSGLIGAAAGVVGTRTNVRNAKYASETGNRSEAAASALSAVGSTVGGAASGIKALANIGGSAAQIGVATNKIVPMGTAIAGGIQIASGSIRGISAAHSWRKLRGRMKDKLNGRSEDELSESDRRMYRTMKQAKEMSAVRGAQGAMETAAGTLTGLGGALTVSGVGGVAGTLLMLGGAATGIAKGVVGNKMAKSRRRTVVEEELGIDAKIKQLINDNVTSDKKEAKHLVLQAMGFESGKRKQAFQHITMHRAMELHSAAAKGDREAAEVISDMGLRKTKDGNFSLQAIAEKLGMATGVPWEKQMQAVRAKAAASRNPFKKG